MSCDGRYVNLLFRCNIRICIGFKYNSIISTFFYSITMTIDQTRYQSFNYVDWNLADLVSLCRSVIMYILYIILILQINYISNGYTDIHFYHIILKYKIL